MRVRVLFLFILLFSSLRAEVDLGNLVIEGEVRRPMLRKIESKNATKKLLIEKAKSRLFVIEQNILARDFKRESKGEEINQEGEGK